MGRAGPPPIMILFFVGGIPYTPIEGIASPKRKWPGHEDAAPVRTPGRLAYRWIDNTWWRWGRVERPVQNRLTSRAYERIRFVKSRAFSPSRQRASGASPLS